MHQIFSYHKSLNRGMGFVKPIDFRSLVSSMKFFSLAGYKVLRLEFKIPDYDYIY